MYRLICTKNGLDSRQLFGQDYLSKISQLECNIFGDIITGNRYDGSGSILRTGLHTALNIKTFEQPSPISVVNISEHDHFYVVHPDAVNELIIQKLQDNPALRMYKDVKTTPARIIKLQDSWRESWAVVQIISKRDVRSIFSDIIIDKVYKHFGTTRGSHLLRVASDLIYAARNDLAILHDRDPTWVSLRTTIIHAISNHIRKHMLAQT